MGGGRGSPQNLSYEHTLRGREEISRGKRALLEKNRFAAVRRCAIRPTRYRHETPRRDRTIAGDTPDEEPTMFKILSIELRNDDDLCRCQNSKWSGFKNRDGDDTRALPILAGYDAVCSGALRFRVLDLDE